VSEGSELPAVRGEVVPVGRDHLVRRGLSWDGTPQTQEEIETGWRTIASYTPEQTAAFFNGGDIGEAKIVDPQIRARMVRQHRYLRRCLFDKVAPALIQALQMESPQTADRLGALLVGAMREDPRSSQLLGVMVGELLTQALQP
jgi:hypothetical protein